MALTFLRHAPLSSKYQGRYNGWTNLPIAPSLFDRQRIAILQKQKFDLVYSSDLLRCTQTLEMMGIKDYRQDKRLREVRFKIHIEGKNFDEVSRLSDYNASLLEERGRWHDFLCAESEYTFEQRIKQFITQLPHDKEILICTHAGTLQKILHLLGLPYNKMDYLEFKRIEYGLHHLV